MQSSRFLNKTSIKIVYVFYVCDYGTRLHLINFDRQCDKLFQMPWKRIVRIFRAVLSDTAFSTCQDLRSAVSAYVIIPSRCGAGPSTVHHRLWVSGNMKDMRVTRICILDRISHWYFGHRVRITLLYIYIFFFRVTIDIYKCR